MKCNDKCVPYSGGYIIPPFWGFTNYTATIPKLYFDVRSQEQRILNLFELLNKVICYSNMLGESVNEISEMMKELEKKIEDPEFIDHCIELLMQWVDEHMPEIIGKAAQIVYFGLTQDGYFAAYIPEGNAWDDIQFDTGAVYDNDEYGRLILYYNVDTDPRIWN